MGRPREHDETTRLALLDAAEQLAQSEGPDGVSVRATAGLVGTTTRAVYSLFGSKDGLLEGLAARAFELLRDDITRLPHSEDPVTDIVEAGVAVFRRMAIGHPALFRLSFVRVIPDLRRTPEIRAASAEAFGLLAARFERLHDAGQLGGRSPQQAATQFNALCEGLAVVELRGLLLEPPGGEGTWRDALGALVRGFATSPIAPPAPARRSRRRLPPTAPVSPTPPRRNRATR